MIEFFLGLFLGALFAPAWVALGRAVVAKVKERLG